MILSLVRVMQINRILQHLQRLKTFVIRYLSENPNLIGIRSTIVLIFELIIVFTGILYILLGITTLWMAFARAIQEEFISKIKAKVADTPGESLISSNDARLIFVRQIYQTAMTVTTVGYTNAISLPTDGSTNYDFLLFTICMLSGFIIWQFP